MTDDKDKPDEDTADGDSHLHDVVFDPSLPLRPPRSRPVEEPEPADHGPDYDPDTLDLFEDPELMDAEAELRLGAEQVIDELVEEYTREITNRLRTELTDQLRAILDDLNNPTNDS